MKKNNTHHWWHVHNQATIGRPGIGPKSKAETATATAAAAATATGNVQRQRRMETETEIVSKVRCK